jgi:uncharacterized protein (DUF1330 family)
MSAYIVLMQQIDDVERHRNEYVPAVQPLLHKHGAEMLVGALVHDAGGDATRGQLGCELYDGGGETGGST